MAQQKLKKKKMEYLFSLVVSYNTASSNKLSKFVNILTCSVECRSKYSMKNFLGFPNQAKKLSIPVMPFLNPLMFLFFFGLDKIK